MSRDLLGDAIWTAGSLWRDLYVHATNSAAMNEWERAHEAGEEIGEKPLPKVRSPEEAADLAADLVVRMLRRIEKSVDT